MSAADKSSPTAEFAHVLMLDIVGFSLLSAEDQDQAVRALTGIVHSAPEFVRRNAEGEVIPLPTGDGMVLVFFRYPLAPVRCATQVADSVIVSDPQLPIRMGIHSGPVSRHTDIAGRINFTGSGINLAQRVMSCCDAGSIYLSGAAAEVIRQFDEWRDQIVDLGERPVKHGETISISALMYGVGPAPQSAPRTLPVPVIRAKTTPEAPRRKVSILYKRDGAHSTHLLEALCRGLTAGGFDVFIDQNMRVGVEWARELQQQIASSYAVVPLLSTESVQSEMLADEVFTAYQAASRQGGLPMLLPVRVAFDGPLPEPLQSVLGGMQYAMWSRPEDDGALVAALLEALRQDRQAPLPLEPVGGAVPLDSRFYIVRPTDASFSAAIERRDSTVLVKGARQMGKTSLLTRALQQAGASGARCVRTDFQKLTSSDLSDSDTFFRSLAYMVSDQLDLDEEPEAVWRPGRSGAANFERFLKRQALAEGDDTVVWALDEVDRLFSSPFGTDVFALFRSWHNDRAYDPSGPLSRLTLAIAYATEAHLFITDLNQSPFNIGTRIALSDFTLTEVSELNRRYGTPLHEVREIARLHALTNGQPYLTRRAFDYLVEQGATMSKVEEMADRDEGIFGDHLRRLLVALSRDEATLGKVRAFLRHEGQMDPATFYRLRSGGLLDGDSADTATLRCGLYGRYLARHL